MQTSDALVDRGVRLFQFLARAQQLRSASTPTTERYERDGAVHWLGHLPAHQAVRLSRAESSDAGDSLVLTIARVP